METIFFFFIEIKQTIHIKTRQYDLPSDGGGVTGTPTYAKDKSNLTCKNTVGKINLNNNRVYMAML